MRTSPDELSSSTRSPIDDVRDRLAARGLISRDAPPRGAGNVEWISSAAPEKEEEELYDFFTDGPERSFVAQLSWITKKVQMLSAALASGPDTLEDTLAHAKLPQIFTTMFRRIQRSLEPPETLGEAAGLLTLLRMEHLLRLDGRLPVTPKLHLEKVAELCLRRLGHLRNPRFAPISLRGDGPDTEVLVPATGEWISFIRAYQVQSYGVVMDPGRNDERAAVKAHHLYLILYNLLCELNELVRVELVLGNRLEEFSLAERSRGHQFESLLRDILNEGTFVAHEPYISQDILMAYDLNVREPAMERTSGLQVSLAASPTTYEVKLRRIQNHNLGAAVVTTWSIAEDLLTTAEACTGEREAQAHCILDAVVGPRWRLSTLRSGRARTVALELGATFERALMTYEATRTPDVRGPLVHLSPELRSFIREHTRTQLASTWDAFLPDTRPFDLTDDELTLPFATHGTILRGRRRTITR